MKQIIDRIVRWLKKLDSNFTCSEITREEQMVLHPMNLTLLSSVFDEKHSDIKLLLKRNG